jgi:hypothetical protein
MLDYISFTSRGSFNIKQYVDTVSKIKERRISVQGNDRVVDMKISCDNNIYLLLEKETTFTYSKYSLILCLDSLYNIKWKKELDCIPGSIILNGKSSIYFFGLSNNSKSDSRKALNLYELSTIGGREINQIDLGYSVWGVNHNLYFDSSSAELYVFQNIILDLNPEYPTSLYSVFDPYSYSDHIYSLTVLDSSLNIIRIEDIKAIGTITNPLFDESLSSFYVFEYIYELKAEYNHWRYQDYVPSIYLDSIYNCNTVLGLFNKGGTPVLTSKIDTFQVRDIKGLFDGNSLFVAYSHTNIKDEHPIVVKCFDKNGKSVWKSEFNMNDFKFLRFEFCIFDGLLYIFLVRYSVSESSRWEHIISYFTIDMNGKLIKEN